MKDITLISRLKLLRFALPLLALFCIVSCVAPSAPTGHLSLLAPVIDGQTGAVTINGVDTNQPHDFKWSWNWGDGQTTEEVQFPATHIYKDRTATYTVTVTAKYPGNFILTANTVVAFH